MKIKARDKKYILGLVLVLAGWMRLANLDLVEFKVDEAMSFYAGLTWWLDKRILGHGLRSSVGMLNVPTLSYVVGLLWPLSRDPGVMSGWFGLLNTLAVGVYFDLVYRVRGLRAAWLSGLMLAVVPRAVLFGRKIWAQDLLIPLGVLAGWLAVRLLSGKKTGRIESLGLGFTLMLLGQVHVAGAVLVVAGIGLWGRGLWPKVNRVWLGLGTVLGTIPLWGFVWEWTQMGMVESQMELVRIYSKFLFYDKLHWQRPWQMLNWELWEFKLGGNWWLFVEEYPWIKHLEAVFGVQYLVLGWGAWRAWREKQWGVVKVWVLVGLFSLGLFGLRATSHPHYYAAIIPVVVFVYVESVMRLGEKNRVLGWLAAGAVLAPSMGFNLAMTQFLEEKPVVASDDYGPVWRETKMRVEERLEEYEDLDGFEVLEAYMLIHAWSDEFESELGKFLLVMEEFERVLELEGGEGDVDLWVSQVVAMEELGLEEEKQGLEEEIVEAIGREEYLSRYRLRAGVVGKRYPSI